MLNFYFSRQNYEMRINMGFQKRTLTRRNDIRVHVNTLFFKPESGRILRNRALEANSCQYCNTLKMSSCGHIKKGHDNCLLSSITYGYPIHRV